MPMLVEVFTRGICPLLYICMEAMPLETEILHLLWHAPPSSHKSLSNNSGNDGFISNRTPFSFNKYCSVLQCEQCIKSWANRNFHPKTTSIRHNEGSYWNLNPSQRPAPVYPILANKENVHLKGRKKSTSAPYRLPLK